MSSANVSMRVGSSIEGSSERFYFFEKAYQDYVSNASQVPVSIPFSDVENKLKNTYTDGFTPILNKYNADAVDTQKSLVDPFSDEDLAPLVHQLRDQGVQYKGGQPFVDLCVILQQQEMATTFAKEHHKEYEILQLLASCSGGLEEARVQAVLGSAIEKLLNDGTADNVDALRLTTLIYRAVDEHQASFELVTAEMWSMGYHWDAFCLVKLKYPKSKLVQELGSRIKQHIQIGKPVEQQPSVMKTLVSSMTKGATVYVDEALLKDENPVQVYRLLKSCIMKNELCENDFDKLSGRSNTSIRLRQVILATMIKIGPEAAALMTEDAFAYLRTNSCLFADLFNSTHRLLFQQSIGMIADVYSSLQMGSSDSDLLADIKKSWEKREPQIWQDERRRGVFREICSSLTGTLATLLPYLVSSSPVNSAYAQLAISISEIIVSGKLSSPINREVLTAVVHDHRAIPADSQKRIIARFLNENRSIPNPQATLAVSNEGQNTKTEFITHDTPKESPIPGSTSGVTKNVPSTPNQELLRAAKLLTLPHEQQEQKKAEIQESITSNLKPADASVSKQDTESSVLPSPAKDSGSSTRLTFKSGGFDEPEKAPSTFGQFGGNGHFSGLPSHYNNGRSSLRGRGGFQRGGTRGTSNSGLA